MKQTSSSSLNNLVAFKEKYDKFIHCYYHETVEQKEKLKVSLMLLQSL